MYQVLSWWTGSSLMMSGLMTHWREKWEGETCKEPQRKQLQRVRRAPVALKESIMSWRKQLTTQNSSRASKAHDIWEASYLYSGTPKFITAVSPKPIPVTFWQTYWDWQLLGGPGWTKAQTWAKAEFFHKPLYRIKHVKLDGERQAKGCKTLMTDRMGFCLLTEPFFPVSGNRLGSC